MVRALALLVALASWFSATPALGQNSDLDPTALIGLPVVTSDGVAVGSTVSVQIDPQGRPTAITARVETPSGNTHVQLPIGATQPGERDVRLNANDAAWRAFLARNANAIETAAEEFPPPPSLGAAPTPEPTEPAEAAAAEPEIAAGNVGAEAAAAASALTDNAAGVTPPPPIDAEPEASAVETGSELPAEVTPLEANATEVAAAVQGPEAAPDASAETGGIASAAVATEPDRPRSILDADYVVAPPVFVVPNAAADLAQLLASGELSTSTRDSSMSYEELLGLEQ